MSAENTNNKSVENPTKRKAGIPSSSPNQPEKKHIKLNESIKESNELTCEIESNKSIFFKIIHSKEEFENFHNLNLEKSFNPLFSNQIFPNETISGYKNLKILISLTPKYLYPHIKITYDKELKFHDNLDDLLQKLFKDSFTKDDAVFLSHLSKEQEISIPKGKLIHTEKNRAIYIIDILKDDYIKESWNFQTMCKFFIDGASFIYVAENFWNYFHCIETDEKDHSKWQTVGFCSHKNFHMEINKFSTMLSQFLILPPYQRSGYGTFLLRQAYDYLIKDKECIEITTEDPCIDFILMRDYTIIKMMVSLGKIDNLLKRNLPSGKNEIDSKETFDMFTLSNESIKEIAKDFKLQKNLIKRAFEIIKFVLCSNNILELFASQKKTELKEASKSEFDIDAMFANRKGPFIYFDDEPEFDYREVIEEDKKTMNLEMTLEQKVEMLYIEYERDIQKISPKCGKLILDYKNKNLNNNQ